MTDVNETTPAETPEVEAETTETAPTKAAKPLVLDSREEGKQVSIELGMRVKLVGDQDKDAEGKPKFGTVTGLEYNRQRVVVKVDGQDKLIVRPASKVFVVKSKAGKIERVERAVRAGRKSAIVPTPDAVAPTADELAAAELNESSAATAEDDAPSPV